jgi:hypothetical protein
MEPETGPPQRPPMKLFLDLDGVLADFDRGVQAVTGKRPDQQPRKAMWHALARAPDFYGALEMMHDAQVLWDFCKPYEPTILTGLPLGDWAPEQKRRWVANMLGRRVRIITCMSRDKHRYAGPGHFLVDDRESIRDSWERAGGIFILHVNAERSIAALKKLGF